MVLNTTRTYRLGRAPTKLLVIISSFHYERAGGLRKVKVYLIQLLI